MGRWARGDGPDRRRLAGLVAAGAAAVTVIGVGGLIAVRHQRREPSCRPASAAPITVRRARRALSRAGFATQRVERSALCGDGAVAVLASADGQGATRLTCALRDTPIFHPTSVSELAPTADGALHLAVRNVECFLSSPLARIEALRTAMKSMSAAVDTQTGACDPSYPSVCIPPPPPRLDCGDIAFKNFTVVYTVSAPDPHGLDPDRNGVGCEQ